MNDFLHESPSVESRREVKIGFHTMLVTQTSHRNHVAVGELHLPNVEPVGGVSQFQKSRIELV